MPRDLFVLTTSEHLTARSAALDINNGVDVSTFFRKLTGMTMQHLTSEHINAYLDGEVSAAEHQEFSTHLTACNDCSLNLESLATIRNAYRNLGDIAPSRSFALTNDMVAPVTILSSPSLARPVTSSSGRFENVVRFVAIAAVIAFLALGGARLSGLIESGNQNDSSPNQITLGNETEDQMDALQDQEPALARGEVREQGDSAAAGASALEAELARVDTPAQADSNGLTPIEITTVGIGVLALAAIACWILIHYRAGTTS